MNENIKKLRIWLDKIKTMPLNRARIDCSGCWACCTTTLMTSDEKKILDKKKKIWGKGKNMCEYLDRKGRCSVYDDRPIICRVMGITTSRGYYRCPAKPHNRYYPPIPLLDDYLEERIAPLSHLTDSSMYILDIPSPTREEFDKKILNK